MVGGKKATNDKIVYLLGVLNRLNAQVEQLDVDTTFVVLDEVVAEATRGVCVRQASLRELAQRISAKREI